MVFHRHGLMGWKLRRLDFGIIVCSKSYTMTSEFGTHLRVVRLEPRDKCKPLSLRRVAADVGIEPSYLSKIERNIEPPPSEETICRLAAVLREDPDVLLAMAGKVSSDLREIICKRPELFSKLIRELKSMPDHAILQISREVTDGDW